MSIERLALSTWYLLATWNLVIIHNCWRILFNRFMYTVICIEQKLPFEGYSLVQPGDPPMTLLQINMFFLWWWFWLPARWVLLYPSGYPPTNSLNINMKLYCIRLLEIKYIHTATHIFVHNFVSTCPIFVK